MQGRAQVPQGVGRTSSCTRSERFPKPMDYTTYSQRPSRDPRRRRRQQARRRLVVLLLVVVVAAIVVAAAVAFSRRGGHTAGSAKGDSGTTVTANRSPSPKPTTPPPKVWVAAKSDPVRVWVGGDSMGGELGWALGPMLDKAKAFKPILFYKDSTGICRWDFYDWGNEMESVMRSDHPAAVVVMMGTNDTQSVWQNGKWIAYGTADWKRVYEKRVSDMMTTMFKGGARRVYWVGMPQMKEKWRNPRMELINKIIQDAAVRHPGAEYVDVWTLFTGPDGQYLPQWRLADGVHFTVEGQQRIGKVVLAAVEKDWWPDGPPRPSPSPTPSASPSP